MTHIPTPTLPPGKRDRLLSDPRLRPKLLVLNVLMAAFFGTAIFYLVLIASGIFVAESLPPDGFPLWWILVGLSVAHFAAIFIMGKLLIDQAYRAASLDESFQKGLVALLVCLAMGEATAVYGLVSVFLGAPQQAQYGLLGFGIGQMAVAAAIVRPRVVDILLSRLAEEE